MVLTLTLGLAGLAHNSSSQSYWTISNCSLWGEQTYNAVSDKASATVWDSNNNCGTVKVRMYYWDNLEVLRLTSWYSHPTAYQLLRNASDGEKGQYQGLGVTKSLLH